jgi:hypothetical protein
MLRLNTAIPPAREPHRFGLLAGDRAGFPNGRRVTDDVVSIVLRAIAGVTVPLVDAEFEPDVAAATMDRGPGTRHSGTGRPAGFPYLGLPFDGVSTPA